MILANVSTHTNRRIDVKAGNGKSFTWVAGGKTCSSISCHGGVGSFTQTWGKGMTANCLGCHGNNVSSGIPIASGRHTAHINNAAVLGTNYNCTECHAKTINPDERSFAYPANHGNGYKNYSGVRAGSDASYTTANGVCSASYCHTDGKGTQKMTATNGWNSGTTLDCNGCHGSNSPADFTAVAGEPNYASTAAGTARANSHKKHVGTTGQAGTCYFCHSTTVTSTGTVIIGNHTNLVIEVVNGGGKTFTPGSGKTCSNISCHGTGSPAATWGQSFGADCTGCHGGAVGSSTAISTGMHTAHINQAVVLGTNIGCMACHANTVASNTSISNANNHGNGFPNYSGALAGKNKATCNAAYCHSDGKGTAGVAVSWTTGPAIGCTGCHGNDPVPDFTSQAGEPNYVNAGAGFLRANSHKAHTVAGAATCDTCHTNTVTTAGTALKPGTVHLDKTVNVDFNRGKEATAVWNAGGRTCATITCHSNGNATWGDPTSAGCRVCHGTLSGAHAIHIGDLVSNNQVAFYNFTANRSVGTNYRFGCVNCHPTTLATHRNGTVELTLNKNKAGGSYLNSLNSLNSTDTAGFTKGGPTNITCETVYCHSNGRIANLIAGDYRQTPNWFGGTFGVNRCGSCHDNPPQYAGQSHYNSASSIGNDGKSPARETGHMINLHVRNTYVGNKGNGFLKFSSSGNMAHGNDVVASTIACHTCHSGIVSPSQVDTYAMNGTSSDFRCGSCHTASSHTKLQVGVIVDASRHINGTKDVAFAPINFKTKAQLANVANAQGWTRNGTYKAVDSYDSFDLSLSTWNAGTKTCTTACHVNQPGITWGAQLKCVSCHAKQ
jgi:predicted CxxxxCH...CXXCH cytochrome family protein